MDYRQVLRERGISQQKAADEIGINRSTLTRFLDDTNNPQRAYVKDLLHNLLQLNISQAPVTTNEHESKVNSKGEMEATVKGIKESVHGKSLAEIEELFKVDKTKWECISYQAKSWDVTAKIKQSDGTHKFVTKTNHGASAKFKPVNKVALKEEDISWIAKALKSYAPNKNELPEVSYKKTDNVLVLPIFDAHIGKLAWGKETGENYDIKIGVERYQQTVDNLLRRADLIGVSKIIFPVGNDFFQYDDDKSSTTKGTQVDSDIRWKKLFKIGVALLRETINKCVTFAPVDVILVQGNHDNKMSFYAFEALRGWYEEHPYVTIDEDLRTRTYRKVGVNLLGFTHGNKEKDRLFQIMQQEARDLWGDTRYAEWIIGHLHHSLVTEKHGVRVRVVSSISGKDAWHYESGYDSLTAAQAIIYNKKMSGPYVVLHISFDQKVQ